MAKKLLANKSIDVIDVRLFFFEACRFVIPLGSDAQSSVLTSGRNLEWNFERPRAEKIRLLLTSMGSSQVVRKPQKQAAPKAVKNNVPVPVSPLRCDRTALRHKPQFRSTTMR